MDTPPREMTVGIVIPTLNEADTLGSTLTALREQPDVQDILIVDGGSEDDTLDIARAHGVRTMVVAPGRGRQLDEGWRNIKGDIIGFLHADTLLPAGAIEHIRKTLTEPSVSLVAFRLQFDASHWLLRLIAAGANLRSYLFDLPYGDQALAVRRQDLEAVGGLPHWSYLEDVWLTAAMNKRGRVVILPLNIRTSARRYLERGILRTIWRHMKIMAYWYVHKKPLPGGRG